MNAAPASTSHLHLWSWIEASVTIGFPLVFLLFAFFIFRPEHVDHHPNRVYIGAALQGLIIGILVAFFVLPLRFAFFVPDPNLVPDAPRPPPRGIASLSAIPAFMLLLFRGAARGARPLAVLAVAGLLITWGVAQWPYLLPESLTVADAAAPAGTLGALTVAVALLLVLIVPAFALLYHLDRRQLLPEEGVADVGDPAAS